MIVRFRNESRKDAIFCHATGNKFSAEGKFRRCLPLLGHGPWEPPTTRHWRREYLIPRGPGDEMWIYLDHYIAYTKQIRSPSSLHPPPQHYPPPHLSTVTVTVLAAPYPGSLISWLIPLTPFLVHRQITPPHGTYGSAHCSGGQLPK